MGEDVLPHIDPIPAEESSDEEEEDDEEEEEAVMAEEEEEHVPVPALINLHSNFMDAAAANANADLADFHFLNPANPPAHGAVPHIADWIAMHEPLAPRGLPQLFEQGMVIIMIYYAITLLIFYHKERRFCVGEPPAKCWR